MSSNSKRYLDIRHENHQKWIFVCIVGCWTSDECYEFFMLSQVPGCMKTLMLIYESERERGTRDSTTISISRNEK